MERTIGFKERRYIEELRILTKSTAIDCVVDEKFDRILYIIKPGDMGLAIGKKGENIHKLEKVLGKKIEMVEYHDDLEGFVANIFKPVDIARVMRDPNQGIIDVLVTKKGDIGIAIGKGGANVEKARVLVRRFFNLDMGEITWTGESDGS
ncbi:MAG: NusA-like transcription termination signal-binding factor [Methanomicrobiales archaeon]|nr:NusA-like transcription termination signal-binding factor [Methanomicrobiales archaeon]